ncbi:MAG TPA: prepilin-type N-terminal cleavage/methylation domain-containing protein [Thermoanaerobaculia bacterium]|nr:prepilin-type N-terminal cleavage/methylation domain-containing protein [Thermoanaerobaculia bacterium]
MLVTPRPRHPVAAARRTLRRGEAGFTLIELLVALILLSILIVAILGMFDASNKLARVQTHVADMQQSLRIAQYQMVRNVRMAGRGGLIRGDLPNMVSVAVRNNVPADSRIGDAASPRIVEGTDVLTVRGVFDTVYHVNPPASAMTLDADVSPTSGTIRLQNPIPETGVAQDLDPLIQAVEAERREALVLVSPLGGSLYGVVELDPSHGDTSIDDPTDITIGFKITGGDNTAGYNVISPGGAFPIDLRSVAYLGILQEYRYYVRERYAIPGDASSQLRPSLAQARFYPGSQAVYEGMSGDDVAENILDLQVVLALDLDGDGLIGAEDLAVANDEWLYNSGEDDDTDLDLWNGAAGADTPTLAYVRINTLARTDRGDFQYVSEAIDRIEDHAYDEADDPATSDEIRDRRHRRRVLQSIVELRNLS